MKVLKKDDGIPVVLAHRTEEGKQLAFWCPFCRQWHLHGSVGPKKGDGDGHRVAHCRAEDSPFKKTGYILIEVGEIRKHVGRKHHIGVRPHPAYCALRGVNMSDYPSERDDRIDKAEKNVIEEDEATLRPGNGTEIQVMNLHHETPRYRIFILPIGSVDDSKRSILGDDDEDIHPKLAKLLGPEYPLKSVFDSENSWYYDIVADPDNRYLIIKQKTWQEYYQDRDIDEFKSTWELVIHLLNTENGSE